MVESKTTVFFKSISVQTVITVIMGILEIIVFSIMSRLLSKQDFGYYAAIMGIVAITQSISEAGLGSAVIQKKESSSSHLSTAFTLSCFMGIAGTLLLCSFAPFFSRLVADETIVVPLRIMSIVIILNSLISVGNAQLYRDLKFKQVGIIQIVSFILAASIGIAMAVCGKGLYAIVCRATLYPLFIVTILYLFYVKFPKIKFYRSEVKGIVSFGGWLTLGVILNNLTQQLDKLLLSRLISVESLGSYNRPAGFVSSISTSVNSVFDTVLFPMLSTIQDSKDQVLSVFYRAIGLLNSFSIILAFVFFFNASLIIQVFFGVEWLNLVPIMRIISISVIFNIDSRLVDCFFRSLNMVRAGFFLRLAGAIVTCISIIIGAKFGIIGVAIGLVTANIVIIICKIITLSILVKAQIIVVIEKWVIAWKPAIIPFLVGVLWLLYMPSSFTFNVLFAILFGLIVFFEFIIWPESVSQEYVKSVYPKISSIIKKRGKDQ